MALTLYGGSGNASISSDSANLSLTTQSNVVNVASSTGSIVIPAGTTAERPTGVNGMLRYNTSNAAFEGFANSSWGAIGGSSGGGGLTWSTVQTANFTAVTSTAYAVNTTTNPITVTLPSSPAAGAQVQLTDYARNWASNAVTLNRNGANITGSAANVTLNTNGASVALVYIDATQGWIAFNGFSTPPVGAYSVEYLLVAGGGGGGSVASSTPGGGGGGAGGLLTTSTSFIPGTSYTVTLGAGGSGTSASYGFNGGNSAIVTINTSIGGGGGGGWNTTYPNGQAGGSGGGGAYSQAGNSGTAGQGNNGGAGETPNQAGGGGGGAGQVGGNASAGTGGRGGNGASYSISGTAVTYAGGGGGGGGTTNGQPGGVGGSGGGGAGGPWGTQGVSATANTGGGGGGCGGYNTSVTFVNGGNGGSGIAVIRYAGAQRGTGGTVTSSGGYTIHTFTSSGTYTA